MRGSPAGTSVECSFGWVVVAVSFALIAIGNASHYITIVALKPIAAEFDWPRAIPATGYSLVMLGSGIGGIVMGRWSDRVGMFAPMTVGILSISLGCFIVSRSTGEWSFLIGHGVFIGLFGNAAMYGPLLANVTRWFDRRRGIAVGIVAAGQSLAGAVWTPVFRYFNEVHGWRETFFWFGAGIVVVLLPLGLLLRRRPPPPPARAAVSSNDASFDDRVLGLAPGAVLVLLCVAIIGCCVAMAMPVVHMVARVTDLGFSAARGAQMLSLALACAVLSRLGWGWASDRIGGLRTLFFASLWQAVALAGFIALDDAAGLYLLCAFFGLGYGGIVPAYAVIVRELFASTGIGLQVGVVLLFGTIGMALGGWLGATIFDVTGSYRHAFYAGFGFNAANLVIVGWLMLRQRGYRRLRPIVR